MSTSDIIQIIIASITFIGIIVSSIIAIASIKQNNKVLEENSRAKFVEEPNPTTSRRTRCRFS